MPKWIQDSQFGFRRGRGCADGIHVVRCLQKWIDECQDGKCYMTYIDLRKYYDTVPREAMWRVLVKAGVPQQLVELIRDLHDGAKARVRVNGQHTEAFEVTGGLRQGCTLAPVLSIIYMAAVILVWRDRVEPDMAVEFDLDSMNLKRPVATRRTTGETVVNDVEFADDVAAVCQELEEALQQIKEFDRTTADFGLQVAWHKTELMPIGAASEDVVFVDHRCVERVVKAVKRFKYLGSQVSSSCTMDDEIEYRLAQARKAFFTLRDYVFRNHWISKNVKTAVYRATVLSSLLYGAECWYGLNQVRHVRPLEVFQMKCVRAICGVNRLQQREEHITNEMLKLELDLEPVAELVRQRCLRWAGHVARAPDNSLVKQCTFGWLKGGSRKSQAKAPRQTFAGAVHKALRARRITYVEWSDLALGKALWRRRAVYGIRDHELKEVGRKKGRPVGRTQANSVRVRRPKEEKFTGHKLPNGLWACPHPGCKREFPTLRGAHTHYGHKHGKAKRDQLRHGACFRCEHPGCERVFPKRQGRSIHMSRCPFKQL